MTADPRVLNRVKFLGYDFDLLLDDLRANVGSLFGVQFNTFLGDPTTALMDVILYAMDALFFYIDRRASEGYSQTARHRASVELLTRMLGYKMRSAYPSSVDLRFELATTYAFPVVVAKGYQIKTDAGVLFEVAEETTFNPGELIKVIPAYQGRTVSERFVGTGEALQAFSLRRPTGGEYIAEGTSNALVDGDAWVESEFLTFDQTNQYEMRLLADPPLLFFGDGVAGNIPPTGAEVVVSYVLTLGRAGNVGAGTIVTPVSTLVANFTQIAFTVTNPTSSVGGDDPETLAEARANAGKVFKSRRVAVTESDYAALAGTYADPAAGRVAVARAVSARTPAADATLETALSTIETVSAAVQPSVDAAIASARVKLAAANEALVTLASALTSIGVGTTAADSNAQSVIASVRSVKNRAGDVDTDAADAKTIAQDGAALVDTISETLGADLLTAATKTLLKQYFDRIVVETGQLASAAGDILAASDAQVSTLGALRSYLSDAGLNTTTPGTKLYIADQARQTILLNVGLVTVPSGLWLDVQTIDDTVTDIGPACAEQTAKTRTHVAKFLASDCKANVISVLILARDEGGFYAAPSNALIRSLQRFLDERKAVEQVVEVESGSVFLRRAVVRAKVGVRPGTVAESVVRAGVLIAVDKVLRDRAFGATLYLEELYNAVQVVDGKRFVNFTIDGYLDQFNVLQSHTIDAEGNLQVSTTEAVTKGSVTVDVVSVNS